MRFTRPSEPTVQAAGYMVPTTLDIASLDVLAAERAQTEGGSAEVIPVTADDAWLIVHPVVYWSEQVTDESEVIALPMILTPSRRGSGSWLTGAGPARMWAGPCYVSGSYTDAVEFAGALISTLRAQQHMFFTDIEEHAQQGSNRRG